MAASKSIVSGNRIRLWPTVLVIGVAALLLAGIRLGIIAFTRRPLLDMFFVLPPLDGHGQLILVDDLLLIQAESGEVALVAANPDRFQELGRFDALGDKTWNHPAIRRSRLLVRNDREAACFELPMERAK